MQQRRPSEVARSPGSPSPGTPVRQVRRAVGNDTGFTLIELLIVIVVIGILASIAVPKLNVTRTRAYRNSMISDLKNLANAQEIHHLNNYTYSGSLSALAATASQAVAISINEADRNGWAATATHAGVSPGQCGVYYGDASSSNGSPATAAGVVTCDF